MIDTRKVQNRRELRYHSLDDLSRDLDEIQKAHDEGRLSALGNWSPGQVLEHVALFIRCALDGFPGKGPPAPLRWMAILLFKKSAAAGNSPPPGFKIPGSVSFLRPGDHTSFEKGMSLLREQIGRIESGDRMTHPSPLLGRFTHEEWTNLQLGHAAMHLSFLHLDGT